MTDIRGTLLASALGAAIIAGGALSYGTAQAAQIGTSRDVQVAQIDVNIFGGRQYCWYDDAWDGPGWYRCGYSWRRGLGWGGGYGWNSWRGGHAHNSYSSRGNFSGHTSSDRSGSRHSNVILTSAGHSSGSHGNNAGTDRPSGDHSGGNHSSGNHSSGNHSDGGHSNGHDRSH